MEGGGGREEGGGGRVEGGGRKRGGREGGGKVGGEQAPREAQATSPRRARSESLQKRTVTAGQSSRRRVTKLAAKTALAAE